MSPTRPLEIDLDLPEVDADERRAPRSVWSLLDDEEKTARWISWAAWTVLLLAVGVFLVRGADRAVRPKLIPAGGPIPSHTVPGFSEVGFIIGGPKIPPDQAKLKHCALLANSEAQREKGLMNRRDLGGYEGMVFQFPGPTMTPFYMKDTLIPLSLAFYSPAGKWLGSKDMVPCAAGSNCPFYYPPGPYTQAIEVVQGYLPTLGVGPGTSITVGGPCGG